MKRTTRPAPSPDIKATLELDRNRTRLASLVGNWLDDFEDRFAEGALDDLRRDLSMMLMLVDAMIAFEEKTGLRPARPMKGGGN